MANSKSKQGQAKQQKKREQRMRELRRLERTPSETSFVKLDIHREIRYITERSQAGDSRLITLGNLVLFSTRTRDAWLLDCEDNSAVCLCRDGDPQPVRVIDTSDVFAIEWTAQFTIEKMRSLSKSRLGSPS